MSDEPETDPLTDGEVIGDMAGTLADGGPSTFKEIAMFILESLRSGAMWAGWSTDGRPAYGDTNDPVPDDVTVETDDVGLAVLTGVMTLDTVRQASARLNPAPRPGGPNRAQRRAAQRSRRRRV